MKNKIISEIGNFPTLSANYSTDFPAGLIVLRHGNHKSFGKGFGYIHILAEHTEDLTLHGLSHDETGVIAYIQLIISSGAQIHCEFSDLRGNHRPLIINFRVGTVVLEKKILNGTICYSVVTAFGRKKNPLGQKIGVIP